MSKLIVNEIEKYDAGQLTITTGTDVSIGSDLTVGGSIAGTLSTAAQTNITSVGTLSSLAVSGDLTIGDKIVHDGDTNTAIRFPAADAVTIETAGTERMRIDSSGNITQTASGNPTLTISGSDGAYTGILKIYAAGGGGSKIEALGGTNSLALETNGSEAMRIDSSGNVGIGTTANALYRLDVNGDMHVGSGSLNKGIEIGPIGFTASLKYNPNGNLEIKPRNNYDSVFLNNTTEVFRVRAGGGITFNGDTAAANALDDYEEGTWTPTIFFGSSESPSATYNLRAGRYTKIGRQVTVTGRMDLSNKGTGTGQFKINGLPFTIPNNQAHRQAAALWIDNISYSGQVSAIGHLASTEILFYQTTEAGVRSDLTESNIANDTDVMLSLTYFV